MSRVKVSGTEHALLRLLEFTMNRHAFHFVLFIAKALSQGDFTVHYLFTYALVSFVIYQTTYTLRIWFPELKNSLVVE